MCSVCGVSVCVCVCVSVCVQECVLALHANIYYMCSSPSHTRSILTTYVVHVHGRLSTPQCSVLTALISASLRPPSSPSPLLQPPVSAHNYVLTVPFLQYNCDSLSLFSLNTVSTYTHTPPVYIILRTYMYSPNCLNYHFMRYACRSL